MTAGAHEIPWVVSPTTEVAKITRLHSLPCHIDHNGHANVDVYFHPVRDEQASKGDGKVYHKAAFRGRALQGVTMTAPASYTGHVITATQRDGETTLLSSEQFNEFICWGHDRIDATDTILQAPTALNLLEQVNTILPPPSS